MPIPILYAGNEGVFDGVVISSLSLVTYCREPIEVYLFTMDLSDRDPRFLPITEEMRAYLESIYRRVNPASRVHLCDVGALYRATMLDSPNATTGYTPYCFLRLFADRVPGLPDRLIYLDTDTVFCGNVAELYATPLDGCELAGVRDRYGHRFFGINYLNSGGLLLDLAAIRETRLFQRALDACARKKIFLPDQTAINRACRKKKILSRRFNEQKNPRTDTVIRHFSMTVRFFPRIRPFSVKPWQVDEVHRILGEHRHDEILLEYLNRKNEFPKRRNQ